MKTKLNGLLAAVTVSGALALAPAAHADNGQIAAGVIGGLAAGAIIGSAIAAPPPPPAYYAPRPAYAPAPVYVQPRCYWTNQNVWDPYYRQYVVQRVKVCN